MKDYVRVMNIHSDFTQWFQQMIKFGLVGVINTVITLSTVFLLLHLLGITYITANVIGYILGFINSYIMNRKLTFHSTGSVKSEASRFVITFIISYHIQLCVLIFLIRVVSLQKDPAQLISMGVFTVVNFIGNKIFTFDERCRYH